MCVCVCVCGGGGGGREGGRGAVREGVGDGGQYLSLYQIGTKFIM